MRSKHYGPSGLFIGIALNAVAFCVMATLLPITQGQMVRPMMHVQLVFFCGVIGICLGLPLSLRDLIFRSGRRVVGAIGMILNLTPIPIGLLTMHLIAHFRSFEFAP